MEDEELRHAVLNDKLQLARFLSFAIFFAIFKFGGDSFYLSLIRASVAPYERLYHEAVQ